MKLALGTVQFGLDYGVANKRGRVSQSEVASILDFAKHSQIELLDTAAQYGMAEEVLGSVSELCVGMKLVTKTITFPQDNVIHQAHAKNLRCAFDRSLERLKNPACYALLVHHADDLLKPGGEYLFEEMQALRIAHKVKKIGLSAYNKQQIEAVLERYEEVELIQLPLNVLDQHLLQDGFLGELKRNNIEVHARSVFLQGLLLMNVAELNSYFDPLLSHLNVYNMKIQDYHLTPLQAALLFIKQIKEVDYCVVGTTTLMELKQIVQAYEFNPADTIDFSFAAINDASVTNPALWKLR